MRPSRLFAITALLAMDSVCAADTLNTITFTGQAGAALAGSISFRAGPDGRAGRSDVVSFSVLTGSVDYFLNSPPPGLRVTVQPAGFSLADLESFSFYPLSNGCADALSTGADGQRRFPATDVCDLLLASMMNPDGRSLFLTDELDPAVGPVQLYATYAPFSQMPGFHGGLSQFTFTSVELAAPEPITFWCVAAAGIAFWFRRAVWRRV